MFKTLLVAITILASASLAAAQSDDYKKLDVFGGFSYKIIPHTVGDDDLADDPEAYRGFNASIAGNVSRYVGLKFDVSGHFNDRTIPFGPLGAGIDLNSRFYNFLGGVQIKNNSSEATFKPFAHALVGAAHIRNSVNIRNDVCVAIFPTPCPPGFTENDTGFAAAVGGGIDIKVSNRIDVRLVQLDYNPTRVFDTTQHTWRFSIGVVFH